MLSERVMTLPKLYYLVDVTVRYSLGQGRKGERDGVYIWAGGGKSKIDTTGLEPQVRAGTKVQFYFL